MIILHDRFDRFGNGVSITAFRSEHTKTCRVEHTLPIINGAKVIIPSLQITDLKYLLNGID